MMRRNYGNTAVQGGGADGATVFFEGVFDYANSSGGLRQLCSCGLKVVRLSSEAWVVIAAELADNPGASITNSFESLADAVHKNLIPAVPAGAIIWVEHYGDGSYEGGREPTWDRVLLRHAPGRRGAGSVFANAGWAPMVRQDTHIRRQVQKALQAQ